LLEKAFKKTLSEHKTPSDTFTTKYHPPTHSLQSWTCRSIGYEAADASRQAKAFSSFLI